mmetsp:Transcript_22146/g.87860  ORF Transcript_22146/g.87860 Transcript_22146/m.87860 type:complete len:302 (+) Transcript_22146:358-1263(+)
MKNAHHTRSRILQSGDNDVHPDDLFTSCALRDAEGSLEGVNLGDEVLEPGLVDVEGLVALDARELDGAQDVALLLVLADAAGLRVEAALYGEGAALLDEVAVLGVGRRGARHVARLLDEDFFGAELFGELFGEVGPGVDFVELDVAERVARALLAARLHGGDDVLDARALREEDVDAVERVHDALEPRGLGLDVDRELGHVEPVDHLLFLVEAEPGHERRARDEVVVRLGGRGGQIPAVAAHALVDDEHARVRGLFVDDVVEKLGALLGGRPRAERLLDGHHVVVDRLGEADDGDLVVVLG